MKTQILLGLLCISTAACSPEDKVVEGKTTCDAVGRCGDGWVCEERKDVQPGEYCYRPRTDDGSTGGGNTGGDNDGKGTTGGGGGDDTGGDDTGGDNTGGDNDGKGTTGGTDTNMTAMSNPPSFSFSGFSSVGGRRQDASGKFAIYGDGFEVGPRLCSNDNKFCVTGSFTP